jgi:hypothetical protein
MSRLLPGRRKFLLEALLALGLVAIVAILGFVLSTRSSVDLSFAGAIQGKVTETSILGIDISCSTGTMDGRRHWNGFFAARVGGKRFWVSLTIDPLTGPGKYVDPGTPDLQTLPDQQTFGRASLARLLRMFHPISILLTDQPPDRGFDPSRGLDYATEPNRSFESFLQMPGLAIIGGSSITLSRDQKSGTFEASLMNAKSPADQSVQIRGSFRCGLFGTESAA